MAIRDFFKTIEVKNALNRYIDALAKIKSNTDFERERNLHIGNMLKSFMQNGEYWDERTQANIQFVSSSYIQHIKAMDNSSADIDLTFALSFRFVLEASLFHDENERDGFSKAIQDFGVYNIDKFNMTASEQIKFALYEMPISIVRRFISQDDIKTYRKFIDTVQNASDLKKSWDNELDLKLSRVDKLNETLNKQESAFNFVGLYAGFAKLGRIKAKELFWSRLTMLALGLMMPLPLLWEVFFAMPTIEGQAGLSAIIQLLPLASITLIFIYYFRVSLGNYNSVRAQVMQIELRKSLCRFIQSYAEYAKDLKNENQLVLSKFEDVIFSNIMTSEEKTPSTFDGLEQIASLLSSVKGGKN